jgi:hypothetical protein
VSVLTHFADVVLLRVNRIDTHYCCKADPALRRSIIQRITGPIATHSTNISPQPFPTWVRNCLHLTRRAWMEFACAQGQPATAMIICLTTRQTRSYNHARQPWRCSAIPIFAAPTSTSPRWNKSLNIRNAGILSARRTDVRCNSLDSIRSVITTGLALAIVTTPPTDGPI